MAEKVLTVDQYIENAAPFAQSILKQLREYVHSACPEVEELIKWNFPNFVYNNQNLCSMAAFKSHCAFTFWLGAQLNDVHGILNPVGKTAMGQLGKLTSLNDLPSQDKFIATLKEAMRLNESGVKLKKSAPKSDEPILTLTGKFEAILEKNNSALSFFEHLSPSQQREYTKWIDYAKTESTQEKRIQQAIEWLSEKKIRNWKYVKK